MPSLRDSITAYGRMREGKAKTNLGASLLEEGSRLNEEIKRADGWLEKHWDRGDDATYLEALDQYTEIVDLRDEIRGAMLG